MPRIEPFERHLAEYEQWFENNRWAYFSELEAIKRLLPVKEKGVEIGVGSGLFAKPLGIKIGLEPSPKMAEMARKRGIKVVEGVAEKLPFEDETFNFALMVTTICFLDDVGKSLLETNRILKSEGHILIGFVDRESPIGQQYEKNKEKNVFYRLATFYSVPEVILFLQNAGFSDFAIRQTLFKPLDQINALEPVEEGYGKGSFIVIRAKKRKNIERRISSDLK